MSRARVLSTFDGTPYRTASVAEGTEVLIQLPVQRNQGWVLCRINNAPSWLPESYLDVEAVAQADAQTAERRASKQRTQSVSATGSVSASASASDDAAAQRERARAAASGPAALTSSSASASASAAASAAASTERPVSVRSATAEPGMIGSTPATPRLVDSPSAAGSAAASAKATPDTAAAAASAAKEGGAASRAESKSAVTVVNPLLARRKTPADGSGTSATASAGSTAAAGAAATTTTRAASANKAPSPAPTSEDADDESSAAAARSAQRGRKGAARPRSKSNPTASALASGVAAGRRARTRTEVVHRLSSPPRVADAVKPRARPVRTAVDLSAFASIGPLWEIEACFRCGEAGELVEQYMQDGHMWISQAEIAEQMGMAKTIPSLPEHTLPVSSLTLCDFSVEAVMLVMRVIVEHTGLAWFSPPPEPMRQQRLARTCYFAPLDPSCAITRDASMFASLSRFLQNVVDVAFMNAGVLIEFRSDAIMRDLVPRITDVLQRFGVVGRSVMAIAAETTVGESRASGTALPLWAPMRAAQLRLPNPAAGRESADAVAAVAAVRTILGRRRAEGSAKAAALDAQLSSDGLTASEIVQCAMCLLTIELRMVAATSHHVTGILQAAGLATILHDIVHDTSSLFLFGASLEILSALTVIRHSDATISLAAAVFSDVLPHVLMRASQMLSNARASQDASAVQFVCKIVSTALQVGLSVFENSAIPFTRDLTEVCHKLVGRAASLEDLVPAGIIRMIVQLNAYAHKRSLLHEPPMRIVPLVLERFADASATSAEVFSVLCAAHMLGTEGVAEGDDAAAAGAAGGAAADAGLSPDEVSVGARTSGSRSPLPDADSEEVVATRAALRTEAETTLVPLITEAVFRDLLSAAADSVLQLYLTRANVIEYLPRLSSAENGALVRTAQQLKNAPALSPVDLLLLGRWFKMLATGGSLSGTLDIAALQAALALWSIPLLVVDGLFRGFDADHNGRLSLAEFLRSMSTFLNGDVLAKLRLLFEAWDQDHNGKLSLDELRHMVHAVHSKLKGPVLISATTRAMEVLDVNRDGVISEAEFMRGINKESAVSELFHAVFDFGPYATRLRPRARGSRDSGSGRAASPVAGRRSPRARSSPQPKAVTASMTSTTSSASASAGAGATAGDSKPGKRRAKFAVDESALASSRQADVAALRERMAHALDAIVAEGNSSFVGVLGNTNFASANRALATLVLAPRMETVDRVFDAALGLDLEDDYVVPGLCTLAELLAAFPDLAAQLADAVEAEPFTASLKQVLSMRRAVPRGVNACLDIALALLGESQFESFVLADEFVQQVLAGVLINGEAGELRGAGTMLVRAVQVMQTAGHAVHGALKFAVHDRRTLLESRGIAVPKVSVVRESSVIPPAVKEMRQCFVGGVVEATGKQLSEADVSGWTAMHWAVVHNSTELLWRALENGASFVGEDYAARTPLQLAAEMGHLRAFVTMFVHLSYTMAPSAMASVISGIDGLVLHLALQPMVSLMRQFFEERSASVSAIIDDPGVQTPSADVTALALRSLLMAATLLFLNIGEWRYWDACEVVMSLGEPSLKGEEIVDALSEVLVGLGNVRTVRLLLTNNYARRALRRILQSGQVPADTTDPAWRLVRSDIGPA